MKLHLLAVPHAVTNEAHSHCAFTGKVLKFAAMMRPYYPIIHYGVEGAETEAAEQVDVLERGEFDRLRGHDGSDPTKFVGDDADTGSPLYGEFNRRLRGALLERVDARTDLVLLPFGHAHQAAVQDLPFVLVESGIGYPTLCPIVPHRVFESYSWMHFHHGKDGGRNGKNYEWVVPNYFDASAWDVNLEPTRSNRVVFLGRIDRCKGLDTVVEVARHRPDLEFIVCGQGSADPWLVEPNIVYRPPIQGRARSAYLGDALACIMPTEFSEPFGGVAVEAMLCGTPVLSTTYGAFTETIEDERTGFRCHTLGDFLAGLARCGDLDRGYIADRARRLYGFERVGRMYRDVFQYIDDVRRRGGWYERRSKFGPAVSGLPELSAWEKAQKAEARFHSAEGNRTNEKRKQRVYAGFLEITREGIAGKRIIDVGGGPQSLLLDFRGQFREGTVLDPLTFAEEDERRYAEANIHRLAYALEEWGPSCPTSQPNYDEAWSYNVLQHVRDLDVALAKLKQLARVVRLWEWVDEPADHLHLHTLTADGLRTAFEGWERLAEVEGGWSQDGHGPDRFYAAVFKRRQTEIEKP